MGPEAPRCPRCGNAFSSEQVEGDFAGICPRCLAGLMNAEPEEPAPVTDNARVPIDTIRAPLKPGAVFKGFEILEILGQGGMGVVYKARQQSLDRIVALKLLNSQLASSEEFSKRFDREAKVLASVNHANVVHVHDFGREDGLLYLVMEHVDGPTLDDVLRKKPVDPAKFLRVVRHVAEGLQRVHEAGLVHRDIKPSNILLSKDGTAKISDFGLAIESEDAQKLTQSGMFVGTPHYVSPEHAQGKKVDGRSDLYSLGVILFEGFAGRPPFQAPSATAILLKHVNEAPPALYKLAPQSPKAVQELVRKLLAKNPSARHEKAGSLLPDLDRALDELKTGPRPVLGTARKAPEPAAEPASKLPVKWIASGIAAVAVIAVLIGLYSGKPEPRKASKTDDVAVRVERPAAPAVKMPEEEKPKDPEPAPVTVPPTTPDPVTPKPQEPKAPGIVEEALKAGNKLFDEARSLYEDGKANSSVEKLSDAAFKAEEARAKYAAVQEIGSDELKANGVEQLKLTQQFLKLVNESRLAIQNAKGVPVPATPVPPPAAVVPGAAPVAVPVPAAPVPVRREAVPDAAALKDAEKVVREVYKADYAKKSPADQQLLAQKLLDQGRGTTDDLRARYVLLREARDIAVTIGDLDIALTAIDEMSRNHEIDIIAAKNAALTKIPVRSPEATAGLIEALMDLSRDAMDAENFEVAVAAATRADTLPKPASDLILAPRTSDLRKEVAATKDEYLRVKTSIDKPGTGDQEALGKYYAFAKGDWDRGLPVLAASAKAPLNALAEKDLSRPAEALAQVETGDGWWDLAEKERAPYRKLHLQDRAKYWYESAYSAAGGLARTRIEKRLDALDGQVKGPVDLLKLIDPRIDSINGNWRIEKGSLVSQKEWYGRIQVRYIPPEEYDLRLVVERKDHDEDLIIGMPKGDTQLTANLDAGHSTYSAFGLQAAKAETSPQFSGKLFTENRSSIVLCSIRKKSVAITVDGRKVLNYVWKGDEGRGLIASQWEVPNRRVPFVGAHGTIWTVHSMMLIPVTGSGHVDRSAGVSAPPPSNPAASATRKPVAGSLGTPIAKGATIDLLALVDPSQDSVEGNWSLEAQVLVARPGSHVRLELPVFPPEEYDLKVGLTRVEGSDAVAFGLAQGTTQWVTFVDKIPQEGFHSGIENVDGGQLTLVKGSQIVNDTPVTFDLRVRRSGITVLKDGKPLMQWQGNMSRLTNHVRWAVRSPRSLFLGQWGTTTRYSEIKLTAVSGEGRLLRSSPSPAPAPPKGAVDLLALIDVKRDSVNGEYVQEGKTLITPAATDYARIEIPYVPPAEYDLWMEVQRTRNDNCLAIGLPGARQFAVVIDGSYGTETTGIDVIDDKGMNANETTIKGKQILLGKPVTILCSVRRNGVAVTLDGRKIIDYKGALGRLSLWTNWAVSKKNTLLIGSCMTEYRISRMELSLPGAAAPVAAAPKGSVDLLPLIDPKQDGVNGEFTRDAAGLLTPNGVTWARAMVPYVPPAEYDLTMVVERKENTNSLNLALPWNRRQVALVIDGKGPGIDDVSGLDFIDGKEFFRNETTTKGPLILPGKPAKLVMSVRKTSFALTIDGRPIFTWKGESSRIAEHSALRVPVKDVPVIGCYDSSFLVSQLALTPVTGQGTVLRKPVPARPAIDLMPLIDPKKDSVKGSWSVTNGVLTCVGVDHSRVQIPYIPPAEYDYTLMVERVNSGDFLVLGLSSEAASFGVVLNVAGKNLLELVDGQDSNGANPTITNQFQFPGGKAVQIKIAVRKTGVTVTADNEVIVSWQDGLKRLSPHKDWVVSNSKLPYIGCWHGGFRISSITLTPMAEPGKRLR